jgi:hypothetical protein
MTEHVVRTDLSLVVVSPGPLRGRRFAVEGDHVVVGRDPTQEVVVDDPHVSRTHASLRRTPDGLTVEDLGSMGGTSVNGQPVRGPTPVRPGDVVDVAGVELRLEAEGVADATERRPAVSAPPAPAGARFDVDEQRAGTINNVGRDQHLSYVQHVRQERESFLREVAATRTRARYLVWAGLVLSAIGYGLAGYAVLGTMARIGDVLGDPSSMDMDGFSDFYGEPVLGVPSGLVGFGLSGVGSVLLLFGIVLHVVAASRRRRVEREHPLPAPWPYA